MITIRGAGQLSRLVSCRPFSTPEKENSSCLQASQPFRFPNSFSFLPGCKSSLHASNNSGPVRQAQFRNIMINSENGIYSNKLKLDFSRKIPVRHAQYFSTIFSIYTIFYPSSYNPIVIFFIFLKNPLSNIVRCQKKLNTR